jgi:hypothetical protein
VNPVVGHARINAEPLNRRPCNLQILLDLHTVRYMSRTL